MAQRTVPFANGVPVAPLGLANRPLGKGPFNFPLARPGHPRRRAGPGACEPYSIAFLPDGAMLFAERSGHLRLMRNGKLDPQGDHRRSGRLLAPRRRARSRRGPRLHDRGPAPEVRRRTRWILYAGYAQAGERHRAAHQGGARYPERPGPDRGQGHLGLGRLRPAGLGADRVRQGWDALHRRRRRRTPRRPSTHRRQGAAPEGRRQRSPPTTPSSARPATCPRSTPWAPQRRWGWRPTRSAARSGCPRTAPTAATS